jgi:hypothetical protein
MKQAPNLWELEGLIKTANNVSTEIDGKWLPSRPLGLDILAHRVKLAWQVFTGKYDAVRWPGNQ